MTMQLKLVAGVEFSVLNKSIIAEVEVEIELAASICYHC